MGTIITDTVDLVITQRDDSEHLMVEFLDVATGRSVDLGDFEVEVLPNGTTIHALRMMVIRQPS